MKIKNNQQKNILMVTRPICLPWDEASKNFAWDISKRLNDQNLKFHLLTYKNLPFSYFDIKEHPIYSSPSLQLSLKQKIRLFKYLLLNLEHYNALHFLFTPSKLTTRIFKKIILPKYKLLKKFKYEIPKTIQTIATLNFKQINRSNYTDYLFADQIITHSKFTKNFLGKLGLSNVEHIYPGIDIQKFKYRPKNKKLLATYEIKENEKVILYTGEYVRLKAMDLIVKAFSLIAQKNKEVKLILACRIKSPQDLAKKEDIDIRFKKLGISNKVIYIETFPNMQNLYNLADIFIFPVKEMTGKFDIALTILEAMASELPTILTDTGALKESVQEKDSAIILKEKSALELAQTTLNILKNKHLKKKLKQKARINIQKHFDIEVCAKKYQNIYDAI